ncbi:GTPase Era [Dasania sp. GY-MA-18]|uniref:GTPase Era n=1 Tax=Dasania phycosphaerae TaxID=2950436 RepID=A0A9J6RNI5_9GAMM|nr:MULTISPECIES: GTPase Era [Dasania]MCR8923312.1 GTPase Era [Dasania sp. GY-MA-18]MCZ0865744.1 GTPase Era [Dasania phycosphaerae]MCZ0869469.1 GTPase Era [Dasania phycosphaerae]
MSETRCGYVAIVGRPNVGKSTLLNHILGQKISITSRKPQTTRHRVLGIKTENQVQSIFVDTPGLHQNDDSEKAINRYMNRAASSAIKDVDVVVFVVDRGKWTAADDWVLEQVKRAPCPVILAVNKVDQMDDKSSLLPFIEAAEQKMDFADIVPVSALRDTNLDRLEACINERLPKDDWFYDEDQITDRSSRFMAAELVREKIMRQLGAEVPYEITVEIEEFSDSGKSLHIGALILVEREGQKRIVIGDKGSRLKLIGQEARLDMEQMFERKVMLKLWVKVKSGWSDDERALRSLGYNDFD